MWRDGAITAGLIGRLCGLSRLLHASLGASALHQHNPRRVVVLDEIAMLHAHHADVLLDHLPKRDGIDRESLIDPGAFGHAVEIAASRGPEALVDLYRAEMLPRLVISVADLAEGCSVAAERNLRRSLDAISRDLTEITERVSAITGPQGTLGTPLGDQIADALSPLGEGVFDA